MNHLLQLLISISTLYASAAAGKEECNLYNGDWIYDETYPLYDSSKCPSIRKEFDCLSYGRPDRDYLKYRWQPRGCDLPRFDGRDFMERMRGKEIMFVGDSVSVNQWQSMVCLLHDVDEGTDFIRLNDNVTTTIKFTKFQVSISVFLSHYLVDIEEESIGRVLKLYSIRDGDTWKRADVLIFNTWLWWYRRGPKQPWDYIEIDGKIVRDMDRMVAFRRALTTWSNWVRSNVDSSTTKILFQGISPSHYNGTEWNEPGVRSCVDQRTPFNGTSYPIGVPLAEKVVEEVVLRGNEVHLLNITRLSQMRKDGHPSKYKFFKGMDCTHWCVAGVLDTWNHLLYSELLRIS